MTRTFGVSFEGTISFLVFVSIIGIFSIHLISDVG